MKIALASQPTLDDSIALNVNRIEKALASLRKKVDLVAFGESYLQGGQKLNVGIPHFLDIREKLIRDLPVIEVMLTVCGARAVLRPP